MSFIYLPIEKIVPEKNRFEPLSDKVFKKRFFWNFCG